MEKGFLKQFSGEFNETNVENPCFAWEFNFVSCKISEIFTPQKFLLLLSAPYSLFKREVIWKLSGLKPVTGDFEITRKAIQF